MNDYEKYRLENGVIFCIKIMNLQIIKKERANSIFYNNFALTPWHPRVLSWANRQHAAAEFAQWLMQITFIMHVRLDKKMQPAVCSLVKYRQSYYI